MSFLSRASNNMHLRETYTVEFHFHQYYRLVFNGRFHIATGYPCEKRVFYIHRKVAK